jgi:8-amino-7-oxononanoate synthase
MNDGLDFLVEALRELEREGRLRQTPTEADVAARSCLIDLASNDYLGLAALPLPEHDRSGAGASGLVVGYHAPHLAAERALAEWIGCQAALLFSSGYAANVGCLSALAGPGDLVVSDALNHASVIDGCRLSRAEVAIVPHLSLEAVAEVLHRPARRKLVVVESIFSMDGDSPDLVGLRSLCDASGAILVVDEAHALGVVGPRGRGACAEAGVVPDVLVGPLGKAFGLSGAFVAGSSLLRTWLWNRARSFVFSTAPSPAVAAAIPARITRVAEADELRARLRWVAASLRRAIGHAKAANTSPIVPWILGDERRALAVAAGLREAGVAAVAIRPPTVPEGTSRLRLVARASLGEQDLAKACTALARAARLAG